MTKLAREITDLAEMNQKREAMLSVLWGLGRIFPDEDIQATFEWLQEKTRERIAVTNAQLANLELLYEEELRHAVG